MRGLGVATSSWQLSTEARIQPTRCLHPQTSHRSANWRLRTNTGSTMGVAWGASTAVAGTRQHGVSSAWHQTRGGEVCTGKSQCLRCTWSGHGGYHPDQPLQKSLGVNAHHAWGLKLTRRRVRGVALRLRVEFSKTCEVQDGVSPSKIGVSHHRRRDPSCRPGPD